MRVTWRSSATVLGRASSSWNRCCNSWTKSTSTKKPCKATRRGTIRSSLPAWTSSSSACETGKSDRWCWTPKPRGNTSATIEGRGRGGGRSIAERGPDTGQKWVLGIVASELHGEYPRSCAVPRSRHGLDPKRERFGHELSAWVASIVAVENGEHGDRVATRSSASRLVDQTQLIIQIGVRPIVIGDTTPRVGVGCERSVRRSYLSWPRHAGRGHGRRRVIRGCWGRVGLLLGGTLHR